MKTSSLALALSMSWLATFPCREAHAGGDYKMYAASGCKVYGATAWTDLNFSALGVVNTSSTPKNIICPIIRDGEASWDSIAGTSYGEMYFTMKTGNNTQKTTCHVYIVGSDGQLVSTYSAQRGGTPLTDYSATLGLFGDFGHAGYQFMHHTILCTLGAGARLTYYYIYDTGPAST